MSNFDVVVDLTSLEPPEPKTPEANGLTCQEFVFTCGYCDKLFFTKKELKKHILHHMKNDKLKCHLCNIGFSRKTYLAEHFCIHNGEKPHTCYYCGKSFSLRCNLIRHTRIHTDEKRFSCDQCSRRFILKKNLVEHQRVHTGEKPFKCTSCEWSFGRRSSLVRHIRTHTGEKKYECNICKKTFAWKYYLQRHIHVHFPENRATGSENGSTRPIRTRKKVDYNLKKANTCENCGLTFKTKISLKKHMEEHKGDYIFVKKRYYVSDTISQEDYEMLTTKELVVCCEELPN